MAYKQQKSRVRNKPLLGSQSLSMGVLSDDFAAVDVREEYATIADRKSANYEVLLQTDNGAEIISCKK